MAEDTRNHVTQDGEVERSISAASHSPRIPALDGIRGLAILAVMIFHMSMVQPVGRLAAGWAYIAQYGDLGVDVFFVLSGYLITGILLDSRGKSHYFRNFYARRVLRIFPLYYAVTAFSFLLLPRLVPWTAAKFGPVNRDALWYWFHLSNLAIARRGAFVHGIMDVSWSLAIEEQFYLLWPAVNFAVLPRHLRWICCTLVIVSALGRPLLTVMGVNPIAVYTITCCRLDGLALGALVALAVRSSGADSLRLWSLRTASVSVVLIVLMLVPLDPTSTSVRAAAITHLVASLLTTAAILALVASPKLTVIRLFELGPLRVLGRYSYGLYLFHYPISAALRDLLHPSQLPLVWGSSFPAQLAFFVLAGGVSFMAALLSWHVYERQFLLFRRRFG